MGEETGEGQGGEVNIGGSVGSAGGDIVGRDKIMCGASVTVAGRRQLGLPV